MRGGGEEGLACGGGSVEQSKHQRWSEVRDGGGDEGGGSGGGLAPPGGQNESNSCEWDTKGIGRALGRPSRPLELRDRPPLGAGATAIVSRIPPIRGTRNVARRPMAVNPPSRRGWRGRGKQEGPVEAAKDGDGSSHRRPER